MALLDAAQAERFLSRDWQTRPRFFPGALRALPDPPPWRAWLRDAGIETRRVTTVEDGRFELEHGPFDGPDPGRPWTALFSDAQHHAPELAVLFEAVSFLPRWRVEDIMLSVATDGASVGPHVDAYDVFLVQADGVRRWDLGAAGSGEPDPHGEALRLVRPFAASRSVIAGPGDVLYLPPGVPHHGVAQGPCVTYSIGFRAPRLLDLAAVLLEGAPPGPRYTDAGRAPADGPGVIDRETVRRVRAQLDAFLETDDDTVARALGCLVTEPKEWLLEDCPDDADAGALTRRARSRGLSIAPQAAARFALDTGCAPPRLFANGQCHVLAAGSLALATALSRGRPAHIEPGHAPPAVIELVRALLDDRAVCLADA